MEKEIWVSVSGWEGIYEVSNMGRVKRLAITTNNNMKMPEKIKGHEIVDGGYFRVQLVKRPRKERYMLHRLVANHFLINPCNKPQINHIDGDKTNNCSFNLEWVTEKENTRHAFEIGLKKNDIKKRDVINNDIVIDIFNSNDSLVTLSKRYGIPKLIVQSIKSGKRYSKVTGKKYFGKNR